MIGELILNDCLQSHQITQVTALVRQPSSHATHPKIREVVVSNFENYLEQASVFQTIDVAFFCVGVYTGQVSDEQFETITVDYAVAFAKALKKASPNATLCFLSGSGADRTEKSRVAFARLKGIAENKIDRLGIQFYAFRPGYIYPIVPRKEPNWMYRISRTLYPIIRLLGANASVTSTDLAKAMFKVGLNGAERQILENKDIVHHATS